MVKVHYYDKSLGSMVIDDHKEGAGISFLENSLVIVDKKERPIAMYCRYEKVIYEKEENE